MNEVFFCWVEGGGRPKKRHATIDEAILEAKRISKLPTCNGRVFVLSDIAVFDKEVPKQTITNIVIKKKRLTVMNK
jgi:hypothetical protein